MRTVVVVVRLFDPGLLHVDPGVQPVRMRDRGCERDLESTYRTLSFIIETSKHIHPARPTELSFPFPRAHADTIDSRKASLRIRRASTFPNDALKRIVDWSVASGSMVSRKSIEMIVSPTTLSASW